MSGRVLIQMHCTVECQLGLFLEITTLYNLVTLKVHFFRLKTHLGLIWGPGEHLNSPEMFF